MALEADAMALESTDVVVMAGAARVVVMVGKAALVTGNAALLIGSAALEICAATLEDTVPMANVFETAAVVRIVRTELEGLKAWLIVLIALVEDCARNGDSSAAEDVVRKFCPIDPREFSPVRDSTLFGSNCGRVCSSGRKPRGKPNSKKPTPDTKGTMSERIQHSCIVNVLGENMAQCPTTFEKAT